MTKEISQVQILIEPRVLLPAGIEFVSGLASLLSPPLPSRSLLIFFSDFWIFWARTSDFLGGFRGENSTSFLVSEQVPGIILRAGGPNF